MFPDLYRGITLAILKALGKVVFIMQRLKTYVRALVTSGAASREILVSRHLGHESLTVLSV